MLSRIWNTTRRLSLVPNTSDRHHYIHTPHDSCKHVSIAITQKLPRLLLHHRHNTTTNNHVWSTQLNSCTLSIAAEQLCANVCHCLHKNYVHRDYNLLKFALLPTSWLPSSSSCQQQGSRRDSVDHRWICWAEMGPVFRKKLIGRQETCNNFYSFWYGGFTFHWITSVATVSTFGGRCVTCKRVYKFTWISDKCFDCAYQTMFPCQLWPRKLW
jgi:hypothetical protein